MGRAEKARDFERSRERRFSDTDVGKFMNKLGGTAPLDAGLLAGAVQRAAGHGYLRAGLSGAALGFAAENVPLIYDAMFTEPDNPEKRANEAYARELPPGHPRKAEFERYAASLPDRNPVRTQANQELFDPEQAGLRAVGGIIEGGGGAELGAGAIDALGRPFKALGSYGRNLLAGRGPVTPPSPTPGSWNGLEPSELASASPERSVQEASVATR